jgi:hypothetical protein
MAKKVYTYNPNKLQGGGMTPPGSLTPYEDAGITDPFDVGSPDSNTTNTQPAIPMSELATMFDDNVKFLGSQEQLNSLIQNQNQLISTETQHLTDFRNNIGLMGQGYSQGSNTGSIDPALLEQIEAGGIDPNVFNITAGPFDQNIVGLDTIGEGTRNWLTGPTGGWGCTSYGCGILNKAGAEMQGDLSINNRMRSEGSGFPTVSGNSQLNSLIQEYGPNMGSELIDTSAGFTHQDLVTGDRIVSNYSTSADEGGQHTMIFTGEYNDEGFPMVMQNPGGRTMKGVNVKALGQDIKQGYEYGEDAEDRLGVTRYTGNMQNLNTDMDRYQTALNMFPQPVSEVTSLPMQDPIIASPSSNVGDLLDGSINQQYQMGGMLSDITMQDMEAERSASGMVLGTPEASQISRSPRYFKKGGIVPQMQGGGFTDWWKRQTLGGGNAQMRQDYRLQGLQARSGTNASTMVNASGAPMLNQGVSGQQAIQQQRLTNRSSNLGVDLNAVSTKAGGAPLTNKQIKDANASARSAKNAEFAGKVAPIAQGVSSMGSAVISTLDRSQGEDVDVGSATAMGALKMGAQGAAAGATFGPYGAVIGAAIGTTVGAITGNAGAKKLQKKIKVDKEHRVAGALATGKQQNEVQAASVLSQYPTQGVDNVSYFAEYGGLIPSPDYQVEGGEVMMAPPNDPPKTDNHGNVQQIGRNMFKFEGDTHDSNSGGIGVQGGNTEFASQTNQVLESGFVFSDRLKALNAETYLANV